MTPAAALAPIAVRRFRAHLRPARDLLLPADRRRAVLRGAFALTLRRLVCHDLSLACGECPLRKTCPYPAIFDPRACSDAPPVARLADPPRPFVVREASALGDRVAAGESLAIDMHVVGRAHQQTPQLLAAIDRLARDGIGPARVPLSLDRVDALDARGIACGVAVDPPLALMRPRAPAIHAADLMRPGDDSARVVRVHFTTPTLLKEDGVAQREVPFALLVRRARARLGALATIFGDGPLRDDPRATVEAHTRGSTLEWRRELRRSSRTRETHPLEGVVGETVYEGDLAPAMPLLRLAELLHVGKHATFGLGRIEVEVLA